MIYAIFLSYDRQIHVVKQKDAERHCKHKQWDVLYKLRHSRLHVQKQYVNTNSGRRGICRLVQIRLRHILAGSYQVISGGW
ncbi:hypothetical protein ccbrp13_65620 [Ktedonobacteria bacterium brp13]|nr:hypothetical protein ccbrp13_65620 [Ktedonobacteria bacterium brp13]